MQFTPSCILTTTTTQETSTMIQDILIGSGIIAAVILGFFFLSYRSRPSDERTVLKVQAEASPTGPDTRPDRPEGDEDI